MRQCQPCLAAATLSGPTWQSFVLLTTSFIVNGTLYVYVIEFQISLVPYRLIYSMRLLINSTYGSTYRCDGSSRAAQGRTSAHLSVSRVGLILVSRQLCGSPEREHGLHQCSMLLEICAAPGRHGTQGRELKGRH